ncbi:MAG: hypothetical protein LUE17_13630 [Planctomycetaceae bacterium]|nr:hypothetical protein [Planctomycetaceae bacterium]
MDAFVEKLDRLTSMARHQSVPRPLDGESVMARIRGLEMEDDGVLSLPLRFYAGGVAAAAALALAVTLFAATAWTEMSSPIIAMDTLVDVMDML